MALELAYHEGLVREAYRDSVGQLTWSVGITSASGHRVERYIGKPQPMQKCLEVWLWVLEEYAQDVREAFKRPLNEAQFAAALSFHYNTGAIKRASWVQRYNEGRIAAARKAFMNWKKPPEIIPRRQAERDLFFEGKWTGDGTITEYTRVKPSGTPDWGSARRVDIRADVSAILSGHSAPAQPDPAEQPSGLLAALLRFFSSIFGKGKA